MNRRIHYRIMMLFMISGAAALIYQVCWQRLLFESVGVDIESVTIIVSTFMMGLGLGALVGGELADRFPDWTLAMFGIIELATAAFGAFSSYLIHAVSLAVIQASTAETAAANFGLLLCPTLMMGATLPILVKRVMQLYQNIGESVGVLYFANTLGAAFGAGPPNQSCCW
jgi:predicted membrane-bound spermidine synthase